MLTIDANIWVGAFDPKDAFHDSSAKLLEEVVPQGLALHAPTFLLVEVPCALIRRMGDASLGSQIAARLRQLPTLTLHPVDEALLERALTLGAEASLRGADLLYLATARLAGAPLLTWDGELLARTDAQTPDQWMAANS